MILITLELQMTEFKGGRLALARDAAEREEADRQGGKKTRITVDVSESLHRAIQMKALEEGTKIGPLIRKMLIQWVTEK